jgi:hypothetical protein
MCTFLEAFAQVVDTAVAVGFGLPVTAIDFSDLACYSQPEPGFRS